YAKAHRLPGRRREPRRGGGGERKRDGREACGGKLPARVLLPTLALRPERPAVVGGHLGELLARRRARLPFEGLALGERLGLLQGDERLLVPWRARGRQRVGLDLLEESSLVHHVLPHIRVFLERESIRWPGPESQN